MDKVLCLPSRVKEYAGVRPLFWHYPNEWWPSGPGIGAASTVRKSNWKFIYYHADKSMELFSLKKKRSNSRLILIYEAISEFMEHS